MTKELLEQYPDICAELDELERAARTPIRDVVSGSSDTYPYTQHPVTVCGLPPEQNRAAIEHLRKQKAAIEQFVFTLPNSKVRRIVTLRAIHGMSWKSVAAHMGHRYSEGAIKMTYLRIFIDP